MRFVVVNGPRQSGKTTLLREYGAARGATYVSLDVDDVLARVQADPVAFVQGPKPLLIDEVQRAGDELVRPIKVIVDDHNDRGQFILSDSSRFLTIPTLSESLAGRAAFL